MGQSAALDASTVCVKHAVNLQADSILKKVKNKPVLT